MRLSPWPCVWLLAAVGCSEAATESSAAKGREVVASGPRSAADPCGAAPLQRLVGRSWATVKIVHHESEVRVYQGEALDADRVPERVNVGLDRRGKIITEIWCG